MADPVIEELWRIKDEIAKEFDYDIDALVDDLQEREKQNQRCLVDLAKRKNEPTKETRDL